MSRAREQYEEAQRMLASPRLGLDKVVTPAHWKWMEKTEDQRRVTPAVLEIMNDVRLGKRKHARDARYSPSSMGMCQRRILFGYHNAPKEEFDTETMDMMAIGAAMHEMWQTEGLSAGYLTDVEVWATDHERLGGSIDGILADGSIFELKSARSYVYKRVTAESEPKTEHKLQVAAYFRLTGIELASIVYQDRDSGHFREYRVTASAHLEAQLERVLEHLDYFVDINELPRMLNDCQTKTGWTYQSCPYKNHCYAEYLEGR